jgi:hypothetical protein
MDIQYPVQFPPELEAIINKEIESRRSEWEKDKGSDLFGFNKYDRKRRRELLSISYQGKATYEELVELEHMEEAGSAWEELEDQMVGMMNAMWAINEGVSAITEKLDKLLENRPE